MRGPIVAFRIFMEQRQAHTLPESEPHLVGVLLPDMWTFDGEVIGLCLACDDEGEYLIRMPHQVQSLLFWQRCKVEAWGRVHASCGRNHLDMAGWRLLAALPQIEKEEQSKNHRRYND